MERQPSVTVLVGRFEDLVARGLASVLADDPSLAVVARDVAPEALDAALGEHRPDVALVDFGSLRSSLEVNALAERHRATRLVVLAAGLTATESKQLLAFGATGCVAKETQARDVLHTIHLASRGLHVMPRSAAGAPRPSGPELLTAREADVLLLLQSGLSNAQIAAELHVGIETVRTHARNVYRKLRIGSRRELAALGRR